MFFFLKGIISSISFLQVFVPFAKRIKYLHFVIFL